MLLRTITDVQPFTSHSLSLTVLMFPAFKASPHSRILFHKINLYLKNKIIHFQLEFMYYYCIIESSATCKTLILFRNELFLYYDFNDDLGKSNFMPSKTTEPNAITLYVKTSLSEKQFYSPLVYFKAMLCTYKRKITLITTKGN
jgi:hypothetical protein